MKNPLFTIDNFKFSYPQDNKETHFKGCFSINEGEKLLIRGNSGSGKSTLLYGLKGIIPSIVFGKMAGEIRYKNNIVKNLSQNELSDIGILLQNPQTQMLFLTAEEELSFILENQGLSYNDVKLSIKKKF